MKKAFAVATIVLMASSVAACGSSKDDNGSGGTGGSGSGSSGSYCDEVQSARDAIAGGSSGSLTQSSFDDLQSKLGDIEAAAPADAAADWKTFGGYLDALEGVLKDAGLTMDDLANLESGQTPKGLDPAELTKLASKLEEVSSSGDLQKAGDNLTASVKKDCNIDLDSDSTGTTATPSSTAN